MKLEEFIKLADEKHDGLNRELLRAVAARLRSLRHESHYDQGTYAEKTDCGTACCIAGWACVVEGVRPSTLAEIEDESYEARAYLWAKNLLGLDTRQALRLFDSDGASWPSKYRKRFDAAVAGQSDERPSRVAADLIEAIADGKVKL